MAKKVDEELADPHIRNISVEIPACIVSKLSEEPSWTFIPGSWSVLGANIAMVYEDSIDLSGFANQYLTFFPEFAVLQEIPVLALAGGEAGAIADHTIISSVPLNTSDTLNQLVALTAPGYPDVGPSGDSNIVYEQLMYQRSKFAIVDINQITASGLTTPIGVSQLGSLEPTAADKLFVYRFVIPYPNVPNGTGYTDMNAPAQRVTLRGTMAEEPTIEYMMRLKRSYELANQV